MKTLLIAALALTVCAGCKDTRLPEERVADGLAVKYDNQLESEARRCEAMARQKALTHDYQLKLANLHKHFGVE